MGLFESGLSAVERDVGPPYEYPEQIRQFGPGEVARPLAWDSLTGQQQQFQAIKMSLHAAMVDRIDQEFGRVLTQLRHMEAINNTLIFVLSDNGASAEMMIRDDGHNPDAPPGSADTHFCLGPGWSTVCNTPFRKHKTWVHEGGIATPLIVHWPDVIKTGGQLRHTPGHVIDLMPTILEVAGGEFAKKIPDQPDPPGHSLSPSFGSDIRIERDNLWWSHEGNRAIRVGQWKLVKTGQSEWELFDIENDPAETINMAREMPGKVSELDALWRDEEQRFMADLQSSRESK
jgi:arylsulfatase